MTDFNLTLKIEKVGDREALNALNDLDKKGRQIIEGVSGATGRALGDVAVAYERGSKTIRNQLAAIADGHYANIKAIEEEQRAATRAAAQAEQSGEEIARRNEHALASASRGLEMLGRTGQLTGRSLDAVVGQISQMVFAFGPGGQLVAAIGITTAAIVEMFMRTSREAKKAADEAVKEFARIAHLDVKGQGEEASALYNGDPYAADAASRPSFKSLEADTVRQRARIAAGTSKVLGAYGIITKELTDDAKAATDELEVTLKELQRRRDLLTSLTGPGGSIERAGTAQAAEDRAGLITDRIKERERAEKEASRLANEQARQALQVGLADYNAFLRQKQEAYKHTSEETVREFEKEQDTETNIALTQANAQARNAQHVYTQSLEQTIKEMNASRSRAKGMDLYQLRDAISKTIEEGGVFLDDAIESFAKRAQATIAKTVGDGIAAGFEEAFRADGFQNPFAAFAATVLSGLGGFMEQLGAQMIVIGVALDALASSLLSLNGPAAIAAGVALVAAGAGLKAIAGSFGKTARGSGGGSSASGGTNAPLDFLRFGVQGSGASTSSTPAPDRAPSIGPFYVIGNDPKVQRDISVIVESAIQRSLIPSLADR